MEDNLKEKEEIKKKEPDVKTKRKKAKIAVLSLSTFVVLFVGLQVYASTNGYGNVFFMIKEWVTGEKVVEEGKIFSDQEITLSYRSIELAEGLKIQVNRLEIKDGKTRLYAVVKAEDGKQLPLKYEVYSESKEGTSVTSSTIKKIVGVKPQNEAEHSYTEVLELDYAIKENATLVVKISDTNDKELKTLEINLDTREITVKGEEKLEKISKIELKKYLDIFLLMNDPSNYTESDNLIEISAKIQAITDSKISIKRETINEIVKEFYGEKAKFETVKDAQGKDVEILKDMRVGRYDKGSDDYELMEHDRFGKCLKIESASYENGVYTIKYIYTLANQFDEDKDNLEDLPQYETTIQLKRVEGNKYSKYQIVSIGNATQIKEKVNTTVTEENQNDEEDFEYIFDVNKDNNTNDGNSTSSEPQMGETRQRLYEEYAKKVNLVEVEDQVTDMKIKVPSEFATTIQTTDSDMFIESVGDEYWTDGQNTKICINVYRPRLITTNSAEYSNAEKVANTENDVGLNCYTTGMWHQTSVPANAITRGNKGERYTNYKKVDKGYVESRVDILFYNNFDGEIEWIEGEILSSYVVNKTPENKNIDIKDYTSSENWKEVWPEGIGMKCKLPNDFTHSIIKNYDNVRNQFSAEGKILVENGSYSNGAGEADIKITFIHDQKGNVDEEWQYTWSNPFVEGEEVESKDNKGWSDWKLLAHNDVKDGWYKLSYVRTRNGEVEQVIVEKRPSGAVIDKFVKCVLETVSSTSV